MAFGRKNALYRIQSDFKMQIYAVCECVCVCGVNIFKCTAVVNPSKMEDMEEND
jgi:hypothetical protein